MRIAIVGLGLIGTSIALAVRRAQPDATLLGVERDAEVLAHPRIAGTFTRATSDLGAVAGADLIVLATPVDVILDTLPRVAPLAPAALVTDTGSTKRAILAAAAASGLRRFAGGHPMAGSDRTGPNAAHEDLFVARPWFLMGPAAADVAPVVQTLGASPVFMPDDGAEHDRLMAAVSHLPQVVVSVLMARVGETVGREGLQYAGGGLRDTTRLAGSEARVWESILATNAEAVGPLLRDLAGDLQRLAGRLHDRTAIRRLFGLANLYRRDL